MGGEASFQISESQSNRHPPGTKVCPPEFKTQTAWYTGFLVSVFLTHTCGFCQGTTGTLGYHLANSICTSGTECSF